MLRILCDPSSGSKELYLTEITCSDTHIFCRMVGLWNVQKTLCGMIYLLALHTSFCNMDT
jgi:hypothetical protein